jgi:hypothetical protein
VLDDYRMSKSYGEVPSLEIYTKDKIIIALEIKAIK